MPSARKPSRRPRGRPQHKPTAATRKKVEELRMCNMSHDNIALVIGIERDTLTKHYPDELEHGTARRLGELYAMTFRDARKGNAAARKMLMELGRLAAAAQGLIPPGAAAGAEAPQPVVPATGKAGKKELALAAAETAGQNSDWGNDLTAPPAGAASASKH